MIRKETRQTDELGSIEWSNSGRDIPKADFLP
jgi:hypothetical protein